MPQTDTLFVVDNTPYTRQDCDRALASLCQHPALISPQRQRIAVCLQDTLHWLALCLHLKEQGGSVLPIHPGTPLAAARDLAQATGCSHLLHGDGTTLEPLAPRPGAPDPAPYPGGELIQLSSGTTGQPKTIVRAWSSIERELDSYLGQFTEANGLTPIVACPVTHSYGLICGVLAGLRRGAAPRVITNLNPRFILVTLKDTPDHLLYAAPTLVSLLVKMLPAEQCFHTVMLSGAALPAPLLDTLVSRSQRLCQQYGCSEAGCIAIAPNVRDAGLMGTPLPHLTVQAGSGASTPAEIRVTPRHGNGQTIQTRDLGYVDDQGQLHLLARMDDTINVAGINVYPADVENVFLRHPDIREAIAYKRADSYAGERVCLRFVSDESLDIEALRRWCRDRLSPHQVPVMLEQAGQIPTLPNGKISRRLLSEQSDSDSTSTRTESIA